VGGVSECDYEAPIMRRPWPTGGCCAMKNGILELTNYELIDYLKISVYHTITINLKRQ
jgi:hypothetical protein